MVPGEFVAPHTANSDIQMLNKVKMFSSFYESKNSSPGDNNDTYYRRTAAPGNNIESMAKRGVIKSMDANNWA
jgi:hypothetical protein